MQTDEEIAAGGSDNWFEDGSGEADDFQIKEYDITASPNDFNMSTMFSFIESGAVKIPGFQRNYVWDIKRASKLIESIIIGLPIPQIFLYEEARNKFLVIDGQQRLIGSPRDDTAELNFVTRAWVDNIHNHQITAR